MIYATATPSRIVTGQDKTITYTIYQDGSATDIGTVTIGIVDANGDTVVAAGTAVTDNADGTYEHAITSPSEPNVYYVTLTESGGDAVTVPVEVSGALLFAEHHARAFAAKANGTGPLASATEYTDAMIADERNAISDLLEDWTNRSWVPRYCRKTFVGSGERSLWLSDGNPITSAGEHLHRPGSNNDVRTIISCTINGTAVTASNIQFDPTTGHLWRTDGVFTAGTSTNRYNIVLEYTYGTHPETDSARRIGLLLAVDRLVPSAISDRATSFTDELGTLRFETPGRFGNVSTLPEVNHWVKTHSLKTPII